MFRLEWKNIFKNKLLLVILAAISIIPAIYTTLFLGSMWDPYGELENLPVAVVNQDKEVKYNDKKLNIGEKLVDNLKEKNSLTFNFVDSDEAERGLKNGTFYMVITIPENFSKNASTLMNKNPKKMQLRYQTNPGSNYIASKLSESALLKIKNSISDEVTEVYTKTVFDQLTEVADGMEEAVDGTRKLRDGEDDIIAGNQKITDNLKVLAESSLTLKEGNEKFTKKLKQYTDGVSKVDSAAEKLASGATKIHTGTGTLDNGIAKLDNGAKKLKTGTESLKDGADSLANGASELKNGTSTLSTGVYSLKDGTASLKSGTTAFSSGFSEYQKNFTSAVAGTNSVSSGASQLLSGIKLMSGSLSEKIAGMSEMVKKVDDLDKNEAALNAGVNAGLSLLEEETLLLKEIYEKRTVSEENLNKIYAILGQMESSKVNPSVIKSGSQAVSDGVSRLNKEAIPSLVVGLQSLQGGLNQAQTGAEKLSQGSLDLCYGMQKLKEAGDQLGTAANTISSGAAQLDTGADNLKNGATTLDNGVEALKSGAVKLADGTKSVDTGAGSLVTGMGSVAKGSQAVVKGTSTLADGANGLKLGTKKLTENNQALLNGAAKLADGAGKISIGANKLSDGSTELGAGMKALMKGTKKLSNKLSDGTEEIKKNEASDDTVDMFVNPVTAKEKKITKVENNGHAMAAYMMSVGLWVACIAFCLMYPLTAYTGEIKSGIAWWFSKASVIYPLSMAMPVVMIGALRIINGFHPIEMKKTILFACLISITFMSMMYFFNVLLGKVGSFLMLVFMVVQLAGSAGTYPVELSGSFVGKIHKYMPFSYSVDGFRSTVSGGMSIRTDIQVLTGITIVFTLLTICIFAFRAERIKKNKFVLIDWMEEKGFA